MVEVILEVPTKQKILCHGHRMIEKQSSRFLADLRAKFFCVNVIHAISTADCQQIDWSASLWTWLNHVTSSP